MQKKKKLENVIFNHAYTKQINFKKIETPKMYCTAQISHILKNNSLGVNDEQMNAIG